jgi:membrane protease YdiL (CAAX protease family)
MTNDDFPPRETPRSRFGSKFSRWVTLVLGVLLAIVFVLVLVPVTPEQRVRGLDQPARTVVRYFERNLELHEALSASPSWMRRAGELFFDGSIAPLSGAIHAYREVLALDAHRRDFTADSAPRSSPPADATRGDHDPAGEEPRNSGDDRSSLDPARGFDPSSDSARSTSDSRADAAGTDDPELVELRARLAILLEEAGRSDEALDEIHELERAGHSGIAGAVRAAYGERPRESPAGDPALELASLSPGWAADHARRGLAERTGDAEESRRLAQAAKERDDRWRERASIVALLYLAPCAIGLVLLLGWLWKDRPRIELASARIPPPWSWDDGLAVLVRSAFAGIIVSIALMIGAHAYEHVGIAQWVELFGSIPMIFWIGWGLLAPNGVGFGSAFGLRRFAIGTRRASLDASVAIDEASLPAANATPSIARRAACWIAFILGLFALDQLGAGVIEVVCRSVGVEGHWGELVQENLIWSPTSQALLGAVDGAVWAPIFEEIGCRGLLYLTLRTRAGPQSAALMSAMLFAMPHEYSLSGFLSVAWTGYVFALAFERCRSLLPGMICHALWNGMVIGSSFVLYR